MKIFLSGEVQRNASTFGAVVSNSYTTPHVRRCAGKAEGGFYRHLQRKKIRRSPCHLVNQSTERPGSVGNGPE